MKGRKANTLKQRARRALTNARLRAGLTQQDMADLIGRDRVAYNRIENGAAIPSVKIALRIAQILGGTVEEFFLPYYVQISDRDDLRPTGTM